MLQANRSAPRLEAEVWTPIRIVCDCELIELNRDEGWIAFLERLFRRPEASKVLFRVTLNNRVSQLCTAKRP